MLPAFVVPQHEVLRPCSCYEHTDETVVTCKAKIKMYMTQLHEQEEKNEKFKSRLHEVTEKKDAINHLPQHQPTHIFLARSPRTSRHHAQHAQSSCSHENSTHTPGGHSHIHSQMQHAHQGWQKVAAKLVLDLLPRLLSPSPLLRSDEYQVVHCGQYSTWRSRHAPFSND